MPVFNQSRSYIIRILFVLAFLVIFGQLFNLQILSSEYAIAANNQALLYKPVYPARGVIFDRTGNTIVRNVRTYDLMVTPSKVVGVDTAYLCRLLEIDTTEFRKRIKMAKEKNGSGQPSAFEDLLTQEKYARLDEN